MYTFGCRKGSPYVECFDVDNPETYFLTRRIVGADGYEIQGQLEYLKVSATYSLSLGGETILNITSTTDIFDGHFKTFGSLTFSRTNSVENEFLRQTMYLFRHLQA